MPGAQEIQHILTNAALKVPLLLTIAWSHILSTLKPCSFELIIKGVWWTPFWRLLKHIQFKHETWRFPKIHLWGKSPCDFINSIELHKKKWIGKVHQTSVSVAPNAYKPLWKWASPCSFGCPDVDLHRHTKKKSQYFIWFYRYFLKSLISRISSLTTPLMKNDVVWKSRGQNGDKNLLRWCHFPFWP